MTTSQRQLMAQFVADYNGGKPVDYLDDIDVTLDAFDLYDGSAWAVVEGPLSDPDYGVPARYFSSVRVAKGQPEMALWVMDFGDFRAVCQL